MLVVWRKTSQPEDGMVSWEAGWEVAASSGRLLAEAPCVHVLLGHRHTALSCLLGLPLEVVLLVLSTKCFVLSSC